MTIHERMKSYSVRVNEGSGVLIRPMSTEYSYVLTAKHNVEGQKVEIYDLDGILLPYLEIYPHKDKGRDCAIIKIKLIAGLTPTRYHDEYLQHNAESTLAGFPTLSRYADVMRERCSLMNGKISSVDREGFTFTAENLPNKNIVDGYSGGGVYLIKNDEIYLIGIEYRMDGEAEQQQYSIVRCLNFKCFDEIVEENKLAPLIPSYFECFSQTIKYTFQYTEAIKPESFKNLKLNLAAFASALVAGGLPTPEKLLAEYGSQLLLTGESNQSLYDMDLWFSFFEFLIICSIIDDVASIDGEYIKNLEKNRRFIYSRNGDNWVRHLQAIIDIADELLGEDGTVVIRTNHVTHAARPTKKEISFIVPDISIVPSEMRESRIDLGKAGSVSGLNLLNLCGLHYECVISDEPEYAKSRKRDLIKLFRDNHNVFIK